jgi:MFS family permease
MALHFLLGFVTGPASDRHGPRRLLLAGAAVMSAGLVLTSMAPTLWIAGVTYGVGTGVGTACTYVPMISAVAGWFERRRPIALGIAVAGVGVGTLAVTPLAARLVSQHGVRTSCLIFGLAAALLVPACALAVHRPPRPARPAPESSGPVFQAPDFMRLYGSAAGFTVGVFVPMVFLAPFAEHHGMPTLQAASLVGIVGGASAAGRLILGAMAAHWDALALYRTCFLVAGAVIDLTDGYSAAIVVSAAVVFGSWAPLRPFRRHRDRSQPHHEARSDRPARTGTAWTWVSAALATIIRALAAEWRLRRAIRELESLEDHRLRDLGLTRRNIERAVRRGRRPDADIPPASSLNRTPARETER